LRTLTERVGLNLQFLSRIPRIGLLFAAIAVIFSALASGQTASATEIHSTDNTSGNQLVIRGTTKNDGVGVAGIQLHVTGPKFDQTATTDKDGKWEMVVPTKAVYTVEIVITSLPKGITLTDPSVTSRKADVTMLDSAAVLFPLGKGTMVVQSFGDQLMIRLFAGLNLGLLLAVAAIGISLIFGTTGLNNFAHGDMLSFGAMMGWLFATVMGMNIIVAGIITVILTAAFGWLQDAIIWKPLRKRRLGLNQMMIVSIGLGIVVRYLLLIFFDGDTKSLSGSFQPVKFGPINTTATSLWSMLLAAITLAAVALFLTRTRIGKATRAVSDNSSLASATGIDVENIIRIVWVIAGGLTGMAGLLYGLQFQASWLTGSQILLLLFAAVTLGGLGTALGATVGAMIIGLVVEVSSMFIPVDLNYAAALVILILVLLVRPQGVLGKKQRIG